MPSPSTWICMGWPSESSVLSGRTKGKPVIAREDRYRKCIEARTSHTAASYDLASGGTMNRSRWRPHSTSSMSGAKKERELSNLRRPETPQ